MTSSSASARPRRVVICLLASARRCLSSSPEMELRSSAATGRSFLVVASPAGPADPEPGDAVTGLGWSGPGSGLGEHVLPLRLVPGEREVAAALVVAVAAASQLKLGAHLVERPAV